MQNSRQNSSICKTHQSSQNWDL